MPNSINGWPVLDNPAWGDPRARKDKIPGIGTDLWVRRECWPFFAALVRDYHESIRKVHVSDGYDYRQANAANAWSDHSSGTAVDINYDKEGAQGTSQRPWWERAKHAYNSRRIKKCYAIVIWGGPTDMGGDYSQPQNWDFMHWALAKGTNVDDVKRMIKHLGITDDGYRMNYANGKPRKNYPKN